MDSRASLAIASAAGLAVGLFLGRRRPRPCTTTSSKTSDGGQKIYEDDGFMVRQASGCICYRICPHHVTTSTKPLTPHPTPPQPATHL